MKEKKQDFNFPRYEYTGLHSAYIPASVIVSAGQSAADSKIIVKEGERVFEGQLIASGHKNSVPVHAPIPGIVSEIGERIMPDGKTAQCVLIRFCGSFAFEGKERLCDDYRKKQSSHKLLSQIRQHGIVNTFDEENPPLAESMERFSSDNCVLGVRLFDFDPGCFTDSFTASFFTKEVLEGAYLCARAVNAESIIFFYASSGFTLPDDKTLCGIFDTFPCRFIKTDTRFYPSGSERVLQKIAKKNVIQNSEKRLLCIDSTVSYSVYRSLCASLPFTDTIVEVNGSALHECKMFKVKIGTPIRRLIEECGGCEKEPAKIVINGLIKGTAVNDLDIPVTKYVKTITLLSADGITDQTVSHCIHCGFCRNACPLGIKSDLIYRRHIHNTPVSQDILLSADLCDDCALCNAACPARLPLYQTVSLYKTHKEKKDATKL